MKKNKKENLVDFDNSFLPSNRKEQFFYIVKTKYLKLLSLGALLALFAVPSLLISLFKIISVSNIYSSYTSEQVKELLIALRNTYLLFDGIQIIGLVIFSLGLSGAMKIIKSLCMDDVLFFKTDFLKGIKENGKHYAILSLFFSLIIFVFNFLFYSASLTGNQTLKILTVVFLGLYAFGIVPIVTMAYSSVCTYSNPFGTHFKNSGLITIKNYFPYVLFPVALIIGIVGIYVLANVVSNGALFIPIVALIIIYLFPLLMLANFCYSYSRFDLYINQSYPTIYRKGLRKEDK